MKKILKFALPLVACFAIAFGVICMNGTFSSADVINVKLYPNTPNGYDLAYFDDTASEWKYDFDTAFGDGYMTVELNSQLPISPYVVEEKFFEGWSLTSDGEVLDDNYVLTSEVDELYAQWVESPSFKQEATKDNNYVAKLDISRLVKNPIGAILCYQEKIGDGVAAIVPTADVREDKFYMCGEGSFWQLEISFLNLQVGDKIYVRTIGDKNDLCVYNTINYDLGNTLEDPNNTDWVELDVENLDETPYIYMSSSTVDDKDTYMEVRLERNDIDIPLKLQKSGCAIIEEAYDVNIKSFISDKGIFDVNILYINTNNPDNIDTPTYMYELVDCDLGTEAPKSSSSKKYKANTTTGSGEKISGSGKKNSTRTITPIEGKKVKEVIVKDNDNNIIDVTLNEDGTYSFKQPASNVEVQIVYQNREIKLEIGSSSIDVDGEITNAGVAPIVRENRTMLPIRCIAENLGAKVGWEEKNPNVVTISKGDTTIVLHLGSNKAIVNEKEYELDAVAFAEHDRTFVPLRFVSEHLNADVIWNEENPSSIVIIEK